MEISVYLNFPGTCAEAFRVYERVLGGTILMLQTHGDSPMKDQVPPEWKDAVIHVRMKVGTQLLMGSDAPGAHYEKPQGFAVSLNFRTVEESKRVFDALAEGGRMTMPFASTFWSAGFGGVVDRFGTPWMINTEPTPLA
ncbi:MAG: VOC family protein [Vicinamibacterales bacterium]